ncbi:VaFE repeat-containing surface-anchored protein [Actinobaculum suis]|uniref:VaFE repeat-containing surface-anchored protein n=1 Tax=Actinobaculum suis TaxID=1657 RepID=UPI0018CE4A14|nr:VaFE repeat-containing surface-anchored protein [Actinobaculum suis]
MVVPTLPAKADWDASVGRGLDVPGVNAVGYLRLGPHYVETPSINGQTVERVPIWCINGTLADPGPNEMTSIATLTDASQWGPAEMTVNTPQMAWLLNKYQYNQEDVNLAALSYLIHVNFESNKNGRAQATINELVGSVRANLPQVEQRAQQYVQEARQSAIVGYESFSVQGDGARTGAVNGLGQKSETGSYIAGLPLSVTLDGPAVFDATGTNTWSGTTASEPISLAWRATGNGEVTGKAVYHSEVRRTLTKFGADGAVQDMLSYGNRPASDPESITVDGPSWRVIFDFQPVGVSKARVVEVNTDSKVRDDFRTGVDKSYGDGTWTVVDGQPVPVTYTATAYLSRTKPVETDTVPAGVVKVGSVDVVASGEGQDLTAELDLQERGWVTWVWSVDKAKQGGNAKYVHDNWADHYGLADETTKENFTFRPIGVSNVGSAKVIEAGEVPTDTFVANADPAFRDGEWTRLVEGDGSFDEGDYVPVTYRASAYLTGEVLPVTGEIVPADAKLLGSVTVTAKGPGEELSVSLGKPAPAGFVTWVWEVKPEDQDPAVAQWIETGWTDQYGLADETTSARFNAVIDSALSIRDTKAGTYLVDDLWVSGMPSNHGEFAGGAGFAADEAKIAHEVLFFPQGLDVVEANRDKAEKIGVTVELDAKNGFYPSVGDPSWLMKKDEAGENLPGTYVFVSTFTGDDRVAPLTTSVEDTKEQFTVKAVPSLGTTLMYEGRHDEVPAVGQIELVDRVCYTNVEPGKTYEIAGKLMDKATGKPLDDESGKPVTSKVEITPETANGCTEVVFKVDASLYAGKQTVAFEELYEGENLIAVHADLEDAGQTVSFAPRLKTSAANAADGSKVVAAGPGAKIVDQVCVADDSATDFVAGREYQIRTTLKTSSGEDVVDQTGKRVVVDTTFVPEKVGDCATVTMEFDASNLAGQKVVVFEDVSHDGELLTVHHDLEDEAQTVEVGKLPVPDAGRGSAARGLAHSGAKVAGLAVLAMAGVGLGGVLVYLRRKRELA